MVVLWYLYCPLEKECPFNDYEVCKKGHTNGEKSYEPTTCVIYYFEKRLKEEIEKI